MKFYKHTGGFQLQLPGLTFSCGGGWWFRLFGWGVRYVNHSRRAALFSERFGTKKHLHIGPHCFSLLRAGDTP